MAVVLDKGEGAIFFVINRLVGGYEIWFVFCLDWILFNLHASHCLGLFIASGHLIFLLGSCDSSGLLLLG